MNTGSERENIHNSVHHLLLALIAFLIPFGGGLLPPFIILLGLNWLAEGKFAEKFSALKHKRIFFVFISLYFLYATGLLYSSNKNAALFDLEEKLSLLILPLLIGASPDTRSTPGSRLFHPAIAFIAGCLCRSVFNLFLLLLHYLHTGKFLLFYTAFSPDLHPSYLAMYLSLAIVLLSFGVMSGQLNRGWSLAAMLLELFFFFIILLLQSKAGIIVTGMVFFGLLLVYAINNRSVSGAVLTALVIFGMYWTINRYIITPGNSRIERAENNITKVKMDTSGVESNQVRILIWKASAELLPQYFLFGTGPGDVNDILAKKYKEKGMTGALEHHLNAHNQFIQTWLALGLPGLLLLLTSFIFPFLISIREKRYIYLFFLLICFFNFLPEAMLETQAGVVFYAFFNSLFLFREDDMEYFNRPLLT